MRARIAAAFLAAVIAGPVAALAQAADPDGYGDGYQAGDYGRVLYQEGGPTLDRAVSDEGRPAQDRAVRNTPVFPGDAIRTRGDELVEVELADGSRVRLDRNSDLVFQSLPNPRGKYKDNVVLVLRGGAVQVSGHPASDADFRVDTEAASVYLLGDAGIRVEAMANRETRVVSRRGVAEVVGQGGSVLVRGGTRTTVSPGALPEDPRATSAFETDAFDQWVALREDAERVPVAARGEDGRAVSPSELPEEVQPYYRELSAYGSWTTDPDYGVVWSPYGVSSGWRPYWDGGWSYGPSGYFWVSNEPWGWCPYHYGRWAWTGGHGWCWVPGHVFAGAWVSWSWGSAYVGWAPLDYWGSPAWVYGPHWGAYDPGCWTFVGTNNLYAYNGPRYAVPIDHVRGAVDGNTVVARPPRVAPSRISRSAEWRTTATRQASEDRVARIAMPSSPTASRQTASLRLPDLENRLARRSSAAAPPSSGTVRTPGGFAPPSGGRVSGRTDRGVAPERGSAALAAPPSSTWRQRSEIRAPAGATRPSAPAARQPSDTQERVRRFYDRQSQPREAQERPAERRESPVIRQSRPAPQVRETPAPVWRQVPAPRAERPAASQAAPRYQAPQPRASAPQAAPRYQAPQPRASAPQAAPRYQAPPRQAAPAQPHRTDQGGKKR